MTRKPLDSQQSTGEVERQIDRANGAPAVEAPVCCDDGTKKIGHVGHPFLLVLSSRRKARIAWRPGQTPSHPCHSSSTAWGSPRRPQARSKGSNASCTILLVLFVIAPHRARGVAATESSPDLCHLLEAAVDGLNRQERSFESIPRVPAHVRLGRLAGASSVKAGTRSLARRREDG